MNLMEDRWIRCISESEKKLTHIAPHEITKNIDSPNPITDVIADRPDFKGALYQFLIGLLQTMATPKDEKEWRALWDSPPSPDELKVCFSDMSHAFNLDAEGSAFMQDFDLQEGETKAISCFAYRRARGQNPA